MWGLFYTGENRRHELKKMHLSCSLWRLQQLIEVRLCHIHVHNVYTFVRMQNWRHWTRRPEKNPGSAQQCCCFSMKCGKQDFQGHSDERLRHYSQAPPPCLQNKIISSDILHFFSFLRSLKEACRAWRKIALEVGVAFPNTFCDAFPLAKRHPLSSLAGGRCWPIELLWDLGTPEKVVLKSHSVFLGMQPQISRHTSPDPRNAN